MKCNVCNGDLKRLLTSDYCPNECDKIEVKSISSSKKVIEGIRWDPNLDEDFFIPLAIDKTYEEYPASKCFTTDSCPGLKWSDEQTEEIKYIRSKIIDSYYLPVQFIQLDFKIEKQEMKNNIIPERRTEK